MSPRGIRRRSPYHCRCWCRRWFWRRLGKRRHRLRQHHLAPITDLAHHALQTVLERRIMFSISVPERIPHPRSQNQSQPAFRLEALDSVYQSASKVSCQALADVRSWPPFCSWRTLYLSSAAICHQEIGQEKWMETEIDRCGWIAGLTGQANSINHDVSAFNGIAAQPVLHPVSQNDAR